MKKLLAVLAAFTLLLMVGCSDGGGSGDPAYDVIKSFQDHGVVSKYEIRGRTTIWVRPVFHQLDLELKEALGAAFLAYAQRSWTHHDVSLISIRDSRNDNYLGSYSKERGLSMRRPYR